MPEPIVRSGKGHGYDEGRKAALTGQGGKGRGGGRKKGDKDKRQRAIDRLMRIGRAPGELPHEFLLRVSQGKEIDHKHIVSVEHCNPDGTPHILPNGERLVTYEQRDTIILPTFEERLDAAKAAAPYYAPRLTSIELLKATPDDDLDQFIELLAAQSGVSVSIVGEGEETEVKISVLANKAGDQPGSHEPDPEPGEPT